MGRQHPNVLKARRQRRAGAKPWKSDKVHIHVPRRVNAAGMPEDAQPLFIRKYTIWEDSVYLKTIFPGRPNNGSAERRHALSEADAVRLLEFSEHTEVCDCHTLSDALYKNKRLTICYNRKKTVSFIIEIDYDAHTARRSEEFSYDMNMIRFKNNRIRWLPEPLSLESLALILPR